MSPAIYILAPMDDVTDTVFRRVVYDCAPFDVSMTEFVNVDGLCSPGRPKLLHRLSTKHDKAPVIAQLWGKKPENFEQIAREIAAGEIPGFSGIDINFGCPVKDVIKNDCCSAMQQPHLRDHALEIIKATQKGVNLSAKGRTVSSGMPVSVKTRLGFDQVDYSWHELLLQQNLDMLTVHVRTTKQMSKVPAQWDAIDEIVRLRDKVSPKTKIILNGDIANRDQGEKLAKKHKVDGAMIGRGVFHNPYCFAPGDPWQKLSKQDKLNLLSKHLELFQKTWSDSERKFVPLKKFVKIYISGFDGASDLRQKIMATNSVDEALAQIA